VLPIRARHALAKVFPQALDPWWSSEAPASRTLIQPMSPCPQDVSLRTVSARGPDSSARSPRQQAPLCSTDDGRIVESSRAPIRPSAESVRD